MRDSEIDSSSCWTHSCCVGLPGGHKHRACCAVDTPLGYRWKGHSETILRVSKLLPNSPNFGWTQKWFFGSRIGLNQQGFIAQAVPTHTQLHAQGAAASSSLVGAGVAGAALLVWHEIETNCIQMKGGCERTPWLGACVNEMGVRRHHISASATIQVGHTLSSVHSCVVCRQQLLHGCNLKTMGSEKGGSPQATLAIWFRELA